MRGRPPVARYELLAVQSPRAEPSLSDEVRVTKARRGEAKKMPPSFLEGIEDLRVIPLRDSPEILCIYRKST